MNSSTESSSSEEEQRRRSKKKKYSTTKKLVKEMKKLKKKLKKVRRHSRKRTSSSSSSTTGSDYNRSRSRSVSPIESVSREERRKVGVLVESVFCEKRPTTRIGEVATFVVQVACASYGSRSRSRSRTRDERQNGPPKDIRLENSRVDKLSTNGTNKTATKDAEKLPTKNEEELLKLLGDGAADEITYGKAIHNNIAGMWSKILESGLPKDAKTKLIKKFQPAENCPTMGAPKLNPEIKSVMSSSAIKKDQYQVAAQIQLGAATSAVGEVLTTLLEAKKIDDKEISNVFEIMSDVGKILTDLQHTLSLTRRSFITPSFSLRLKTIADETGVDTWLFGNTLGEKLKSAKECEKTGKDITKHLPGNSKGVSTNKEKHPETFFTKTHLNWKAPAKKNSAHSNSKRGGVNHLGTSDNSHTIGNIRGYNIPFSSLPFQGAIAFSPSLSAEKEIKTLKAIQNLIKLAAVTRCQPCEGQFLSSYFLRPKSNGDDRFILNLKKLNEFISTSHFKLEDMKTALRLLNRDYHMAVMDLTDAYLMVPVTEEHRKFLRFIFRGETFEFQCLPFGLCTAPFVFTKLLKPVIQKLRSQGIIMVVYLDDILIIARSKDECYRHISVTRQLLESLGFIISEKKSQLEPSQRCTFLGFILDSRKFRLELTENKRISIFQHVSKFLNNPNCKIEELAQLIGSLVAACPAVKYGWLYTKRLEREKFLSLAKSNNNYRANITLSNIVKSDLEWWLRKSSESHNPIRELRFKREVFTDASLSGWGAFCEGEKAHGLWNDQERKLHINSLELLAAFMGLKCFVETDRSCEILLRMDNKTSIAYVNKMGGIQYPRLTQLSRQIWTWCEERDLWIHASYLPSKENKEADEGSRHLPMETEWELASWAFTKIKRQFGQFDIDLFASRANAKCETYVSWHRDPDSIKIDAFTLNWEGYKFYAFPPFSIILQVLQKIQVDGAEGVVVVPEWPTQPWYPLFLSLAISEPIKFKPSVNLLSSPHRRIHPLHQTLSLTAARLSGVLFK
ncbi:uncharacterized protein LOC127290874 [Leptopilina boulardi]|uniref:uncharacterized protein LOC127290874 n=1 Tax=Leptopilina boulardi TaxID=63433 RepID=UPI0021F60A25|nr:uncharacterized protein LOC127290874 [Leptopilina boulardi]